MQPQEGNEEYQQPNIQPGGAPFQPVGDDQSGDYVQSDTELLLGNVAVEGAGGNLQSQDDEAVLRWQGPEYLDHDKDKVWYVIFGIVTLALMAVAIFLIQSLTFATLIPVMAVSLFVYTHRAPQVIDYTLSRKGLHVNDHMYAYDMFKAFAIDSRAGSHSVIMVPRKRFQIGVTAYFPEEVGEPLVDMLAARLPMQDHSPDFIDRLLAKLRI